MATMLTKPAKLGNNCPSGRPATNANSTASKRGPGFLQNLKETNMAGFGTELEKKVRLNAAQTEAAWKGVGKEIGLRVWRIENFQVVAWPRDDYGMFYTGDSYIVINTWKKPDADKLYHDIHFWLGLETTQDEAGTAAYKTVELDDFLATLPVQHREVQGNESPLFMSYFKNFVVEEGGVASGFKHVEPEKYRPRLLQVHINKHNKSGGGLIIREVPMTYKSLNSGDVFIYDGGKTIIQWNGSGANGVEKVKAAEYCRRMDSERKGLPTITVFDEGDSDAAPFWDAIGGKGAVAAAPKDKPTPPFESVLLRLTDATGKMEFKLEKKGGPVPKSALDTKDVFVLDVGNELFVWIGKGASKEERRRGMQYAMEYINKQNRPLTLPVTRVLEGGENQAFLDLLN